MKNKKTLVVGATEKTDRYANIAIQRLLQAGHTIYAFGNREGEAHGVSIKTVFPDTSESIDTVTLYLSEKYQKEYYQKIIDLKPKRVIFNPGTENREFEQLLVSSNIEAEVACTLVLLSMNAY